MKLCFAALILFVTATLSAHEPGVSNATITSDGERLFFQLSFPVADVATPYPDSQSPDALWQVAALSMEWQTAVGAAPVTVIQAKQSDSTSLDFFLSTPVGPGRFNSRLLSDLPLGHRQTLLLRDSAGESFRIELLSARSAAHTLTAEDLQRLAPMATPLPLQTPAPNVHQRSTVLLLGAACFLSSYVMRRCRRQNRSAGA